MRLIKGIRNHWKKSLFIFGASCVAITYGYNIYYESLLTQVYTLKLLDYSKAKLRSDESLTTIVVFLNPKANNGKGEKTFNRFVKPLLNFSGLNCLIVPTAYEGHVSSLLNYLPENTSGIVVAGGDGMLQETVTSLLRNSRYSHLPVGFIPIGTRNTFCRRYIDSSAVKHRIDCIYRSVLHIVNQNVKTIPVLEVIPTEDKRIYGVSYFTWGSTKQTIDKITKFWWLTSYLSTLAASLSFILQSNWHPNLSCILNSHPVQFSNITLLPEREKLIPIISPAVESRQEYFKMIGLPIHSKRQISLIGKLSLYSAVITPASNSSSEEEMKIELTAETSPDKLYFIDGEEFDTRNISIKLSKEKLRMFISDIPDCVETVSVLPAVPTVFSNFFTTLFKT